MSAQRQPASQRQSAVRLLSGGGIAILVAAVIVLGMSFRTVGAGERGVLLQFGAVTGTVLNEGLHAVIPFVQTIEIMSVQTHVLPAKASAASNDLQSVATQITINYHLDPARVATIYRELRQEYELRVIAPAIQEAIKSTTARYPAEGLITNRSGVRDAITESLRQRLEPHGIVVSTVNITDFDFSAEFNRAIESKVTAEQRALQAKNDLERIKIEAQQKIEGAKAEAESIRIRSEALAQNQRLVEWEAIQKWDGKLPQFNGGGALPFINITPGGTPQPAPARP
ncbi:MAG: prohibitin family protein [Dehalococcoidia bacterium]|nr:prohibitin family protein [Dehalococcoidia bacterium]